ncbi:MAG TPA: hypothetical protein VMU07_03305 [Candidatus Paceibacterota bacterium]|nr:hypothetical protein [Candidatus Paceibacterota bacterium]
MPNSFENSIQDQPQEIPVEVHHAEDGKENPESKNESSKQEKSPEGKADKNEYAEVAEQHVEAAFESQKAELQQRQKRYENAVNLLKTNLEEAQKQYPQLENSPILKTFLEEDEGIARLFEAGGTTLDLGKEAFLNKARQEFSGPADWMTDDIHIRGFERRLKWHSEWLQEVNLPTIDAITENIEKKAKNIALTLQKGSIEGAFKDSDGAEKDPVKEIEDQLTELHEGNFFTGGQKHLKSALNSYNRAARVSSAESASATEESLPKAA